MFVLERHFDAGSGFIRVAPEHGTDFSQLSDRRQRAARAFFYVPDKIVEVHGFRSG